MQIKGDCKGLYGSVVVPGDKSISHRAIMLGALADGDTVVYNFLRGQDCLSTISCFRKLGIDIEEFDERIVVHGKGLKGLRKPEDILYVGNSGTTIRIMMGILSGQTFDCVLDGDDSIRKRPMDRVMKPLRQMGAVIDGRDGGFPPITVKGSVLKGINYQMPIASAQVKSSILMASLYAEGETVIYEPVKSRDHTEIMLSYFGGDVTISGNIIVSRPVNRLQPQIVDVAGDISSAAYFIVAGLIVPDSEILIKGVGVNPTRTGIIDALLNMGADIEIINKRMVSSEPVADIRVRTSCLHGITISGDIIPRMIDEIPIFCVAAAMAEGITVIKDASELRVKESDRIYTISRGLRALGADVRETHDGMVIYGRPQNGFNASTVKSFKDHRVAMSMAIAALVAKGETTIEDFECVDISFPGFIEILNGIRRDI